MPIAASYWWIARADQRRLLPCGALTKPRNRRSRARPCDRPIDRWGARWWAAVRQSWRWRVGRDNIAAGDRIAL